MADGTALVKTIAVLGFIVIFTASITGNPGGPAWTNAKGTIEAGIDFPEFFNPFSERTFTVSAFVDAPVDWGNGSTFPSKGTAFGCDNSTGGRADCLNSQDADASYIEIDAEGSILTGHGFTFNYSNSDFRGMNGADIRNFHLAWQCRTLEGDSSAFTFTFTFTSFDDGAGDEGGFAVDMFCPKGNTYSTSVDDVDFIGGLPQYTLFEENVVGLVTMGQAWLTPLLFTDGVNIGDPRVRFTYFRLDLTVVSDEGCFPPEGAWFPAVDEVACEIINFANFVWKGIQFVASGIAWVVLSVAAVLGFLGSVIGNLVLGMIQILASLFALGAPSPIQEIIDVFIVTLAAIMVWAAVSVIRGTDG